jgi:hypothetical protein
MLAKGLYFKGMRIRGWSQIQTAGEVGGVGSQQVRGACH